MDILSILGVLWRMKERCPVMNVATGKRTVFLDEDSTSNERKRRKLNQGDVVTNLKEIQSPGALRQLLLFQQDDPSKLRQSMLSQFALDPRLNLSEQVFKSSRFSWNRSFMPRKG